MSGPMGELSDEEYAELDAFLAETEETMMLFEANGYLTAVITAPTFVPPSTWIAEILGDAVLDSRETAERIHGLLARYHNEIMSDLGESVTIDPDLMEPDALTEWCSGYLYGASSDEVWRADDRGQDFIMPVAIISGDFDLVGETDENGQVITDASRQIQAATQRLAGVVIEAYEYWRSAQVTRDDAN